MYDDIDKKCISTLRMLAIEAVEKAKSGHPGFPLGAAPLMYTIWDRFMEHNPSNPQWENRDRFILSAGHGSALLYAMLHVSGYDLSVEELKNFRQWGSKTPGHPEYGHTVGVEATTGPLGQGFAAGVGMAVAEKMLAARYNQPGYDDIVNHYVYGIVSDGDLMEGVSGEAASLAGTLGLGKLIYLYDDNHITIEGDTNIAFTEDVEKRFQAYGWHTVRVGDSEYVTAIEESIRQAKAATDKPSLILVRTHIGYGSPKQDTAAAHGEPLGTDAFVKTKEKYGFSSSEAFTVPNEVWEYFSQNRKKWATWEHVWNLRWEKYRQAYPELASELAARWQGDFDVPEEYLQKLFTKTASTSTREASGVILQKLAEMLPALCGGSADLAPSNKSYINEAGDFSAATPEGRNLHFGVREAAMTAVVNGMALHGGFIPYGATFLVFADFMRPAIRLAALMGTHSIFVLTHDSIAVGEDGPTHQPIEQAMSLRIIPGLNVLRPADALETAAAWRVAVNARKPVALLLTRQKLPVLHDYASAIEQGAGKGGYVISDSPKARLSLLATGSEVSLALSAQKALNAEGISARVVSLPSWEMFDAQSEEYRSSVLPADIPALAIEAGTPIGWSRYTGSEKNVIGLDRFGASAPGDVVYEKLGFSINNILDKAREILGK